MSGLYEGWKILIEKWGIFMAEFIIMPKLGLTMTEGTVLNWRKAEGDTIAAGEVLFDVETDKLTNEIEATATGVLRKILVKEGSVEVLKPVAIIGTAEEDISALWSSSPAVEESKQENENHTENTEIVQNNSVTDGALEGGRRKVSPKARRLAKELEVEVALVTGTGPSGRITKKDVLHYKENNKAQKVKVSPAAVKMAEGLGVDIQQIHKAGRIMKDDVVEYCKNQELLAYVNPKEERVPMSGMRKVIAKRMLASQEISPTVTYSLRVDTTQLTVVRNQLKNAGKVTYTDLLVKIVSKVLMEFPLLNCSIDNNELIFRNYASIGVAVALEDGLVVPVVRYANKKGLAEISREIKELASKAKNNELAAEDMTGGTFTVTNLGMFGMETFTPIINQPEVAILGVNAIVDTPVAIHGQVVIKPLMNLSLTADHRAVDGSVAAQFMSRIREYVENPMILLL